MQRATTTLRALVKGGKFLELPSAYRVSWALRYQTSELRTEPGDRELFWGGVSVSRSF